MQQGEKICWSLAVWYRDMPADRHIQTDKLSTILHPLTWYSNHYYRHIRFIINSSIQRFWPQCHVVYVDGQRTCNDVARLHITMWSRASLFRRFTDTNVYRTGSVKIWWPCYEINVDIWIVFTVYGWLNGFTFSPVSTRVWKIGFEFRWSRSLHEPISIAVWTRLHYIVSLRTQICL